MNRITVLSKRWVTIKDIQQITLIILLHMIREKIRKDSEPIKSLHLTDGALDNSSMKTTYQEQKCKR